MTLLFFLIWVVLCGKLTRDVALSGLIAAALASAVCYGALGMKVKYLQAALLLFPSGIKYLGCLLAEIVRANLRVMRLILSPQLEIEPRLVVFKTRLHTDAARAALGNAITLTPGTVTARVKGDEIAVHCLDRETSEGLVDSAFEKRLLQMEEKIRV